MLQRHILYVAKTKSICCKDKIYMLLRQNVYVAKTKSICYKDKAYMWQRHNLYVVKTKKKHGARAERARRGFFLTKRDILIF